MSEEDAFSLSTPSPFCLLSAFDSSLSLFCCNVFPVSSVSQLFMWVFAQHQEKKNREIKIFIIQENPAKGEAKSEVSNVTVAAFGLLIC